MPPVSGILKPYPHGRHQIPFNLCVMPKENPQAKEGQKNIDCKHYLGCLTYAARQNYRAFNCEKCDYFKEGPKETAKTSKMKKEKLCKKCGEKPPLNLHSQYCSGCLNSFKKAKKTPGASKTKRAGHGKVKPRKAPKTASAVATEKLCKKCGGNPTIHQNSPYCSGCLHGMRKAKQNRQVGTKEHKKEPDEVKSEKDLKSNIEGGMIIVYFGQYGSILKEVEKLAEREMRTPELQIIYMLNKQLKAGA